MNQRNDRQTKRSPSKLRDFLGNSQPTMALKIQDLEEFSMAASSSPRSELKDKWDLDP